MSEPSHRIILSRAARKFLEGVDAGLRARFGDWRILYNVTPVPDGYSLVVIEEINHRAKAYDSL